MTSRCASALLVTVVLSFIPAPAFAGSIIHVDMNASGSGTPDGASWTTAFTSLQDGLAAAASGDVIYVAQGVYRPGPIPTDTFNLKNGVHLKGGFAGVTETNPNDHDPDEYPTILSGDIEDNDTECAQNDSGNSQHVVTAGNVNANTILEGFVITRGNAGFGDGGGLEITSPGAVLQVVDCKFVCNRANRGGGVDHGGSDSEYHGCTFENNIATNVGGGLWSGDDDPLSELRMTDCVFTGNEAPIGGGVFAETIAAVGLQGCVFEENFATGSGFLIGGGAVYMTDVASAEISDCSFGLNESDGSGGALFAADPDAENRLRVVDCNFTSNSTGQEGGAVYVRAFDLATFQRCDFIENFTVNGDGGAMQSYYAATNVVDCLFRGNEAGNEYLGGAFSSANGNVPVRLINTRFIDNRVSETGGLGGAVATANASVMSVLNCLFVGNEAYEGGGFYAKGTTDFLNCTFTENYAVNIGGGLHTAHSPIDMRNCIIWGNDAGIATGIDKQWDFESTAVDVTYSDVQDADLGTAPFSGGANQNVNPMFVNPAFFMYRLKRVSPCVDAGTSSPFSATEFRDGFDVDGDMTTNEPTPDLDRLERIVDYPVGDGGGGYVDMGAYEKQACCEGDLDHDGDIDDDDVDIFVDYLLDPPSDPESLCVADLDDNGQINGLDIAGFIVLYEEDKLCNEMRAGNQDCDRSGYIDAYDIGNELSEDCNENFIPDKCEHDCNCNGIDDEIDLEATGDDCNNNDVLDECDIAAQTSEDVNENGIPDECE